MEGPPDCDVLVTSVKERVKEGRACIAVQVSESFVKASGESLSKSHPPNNAPCLLSVQAQLLRCIRQTFYP